MKNSNKARIAILCVLTLLISLSATGCGTKPQENTSQPNSSQNSSAEDSSSQNKPLAEEPASAEDLLGRMTTEQKISQMIMPAIRTWNEEGVTVLKAVPALAEALRAHQYGGIILFGSNVVESEQTVRLIADLQSNNAESADAAETGVIPYLIAADQEGGSVARLSMGTRGTGSMAIGATGENAEENARETGRIFGEEMEALGINVNLGPCVDVISDLTDPGMSTRVFSDDPAVVSKLSLAFADGVSQSDVITTYKHFPGAGDGSDYPTSIPVTLEELRKNGLAAYADAIDGGAEMLMTSATTFPAFDEEVLLADGKTKGYYPATLSRKIVTELLREELGFDGVVITDALEMEQFLTEPDTQQPLFTGDYGTVEHDVQVAEKAINAGCDILLIPTDLISEEAVKYYEEYIAGIVKLVEDGVISEERINESASRILSLKERHGILGMDVTGADLDKQIEKANQTVGSDEHHAVENAIAQQAVTLLKNDGALPLSGKNSRIVIIGRTALDNTPITYAVNAMMKNGILDPDARIDNLISGETSGSESASASIVIGAHCDTDLEEVIYSEELSAAVKEADAVVCLCAVSAGIDLLQDTNPVIQGAARALSEARAAGARFILLSDNLPVDSARFQDADAIVCAYLSAGFKIDPTARTNGFETVGAFNANVPAALRAIFGEYEMTGRLPINIPIMEQDADGQWIYGDTILYERGFQCS